MTGDISRVDVVAISAYRWVKRQDASVFKDMSGPDKETIIR